MAKANCARSPKRPPPQSGAVRFRKYGKPAAKIVRFNHVPWYERKVSENVTSIEQLFGTLPSDLDLDGAGAERLAK
jgi:hypothetical protein